MNIVDVVRLSILIYPILFFNGRIECSENFVDMKIVDEPSSFGINNYNYGQSFNRDDDKLELQVQPANFSGPKHFRRLIGRCFEAVIANYKYKFCPYSNITQHEQGINWNPYKGVLGVWQEWEIKNNTFVAMLMKDGDPCGDINRSVRVSLLCGNHSTIVNVTEPSRCTYQLTFLTPLVCAENSMLVYPTLQPDMQHLWNVLEGENLAGELTEKGYLKRLGSIFEKAGIYLSGQDKSVLLQKAKEEKKEKAKEGDFETLSACLSEFRQLKEEIKSLKAQLAAKENSDSKQNDTGINDNAD